MKHPTVELSKRKLIQKDFLVINKQITNIIAILTVSMLFCKCIVKLLQKKECER